MNKKAILKILILFISIVITACKGETMSAEQYSAEALKSVPEAKWKLLSEKKIYFGHQSVGYNLVDGVKDILQKNQQIKLNIVETNDPAQYTIGIFGHAINGENKKPITKITAFAETIDSGLGKNLDIGFFKFCYVDIDESTEVAKLFNDYKTIMAGLKQKYPKTQFVHFTTPLTVVQKGIKAFVKKTLNKPVGSYAENIKRNQFNELLIKEYEGKEPIFDIAKAEATHLNGQYETFEQDGKTYYALAYEYAEEKDYGRHLNELGRQVAAEKFLLFLVDLTGK